MAALLPAVRLPPPTTSGAFSSPLSIRRLQPRILPFPRVHCCAHRAPHPPAIGREAAAASWHEKLAGSVPWKATVSGALVLAASFACCKPASPFRWLSSFAMLRGTDLSEVWPKDMSSELLHSLLFVAMPLLLLIVTALADFYIITRFGSYLRCGSLLGDYELGKIVCMPAWHGDKGGYRYTTILRCYKGFVLNFHVGFRHEEIELIIYINGRIELRTLAAPNTTS